MTLVLFYLSYQLLLGGKNEVPLCLLHVMLTRHSFAFKELCLQAVVPLRIKAGRSGQVANLKDMVHVQNMPIIQNLLKDECRAPHRL